MGKSTSALEPDTLPLARAAGLQGPLSEVSHWFIKARRCDREHGGPRDLPSKSRFQSLTGDDTRPPFNTHLYYLTTCLLRGITLGEKNLPLYLLISQFLHIALLPAAVQRMALAGPFSPGTQSNHTPQNVSGQNFILRSGPGPSLCSKLGLPGCQPITLLSATVKLILPIFP